MYRDLWGIYWHNGINKYVAEFVDKYSNKLENWTSVTKRFDIDFIIGFSCNRWQHDIIWVVVDLMMNTTNCIPVKASYLAEDFPMF